MHLPSPISVGSVNCKEHRQMDGGQESEKLEMSEKEKLGKGGADRPLYHTYGSLVSLKIRTTQAIDGDGS